MARALRWRGTFMSLNSILPSTIHYLNKVTIWPNTVNRRVIGFKFDLWNDKVTIMAQGSTTL